MLKPMPARAVLFAAAALLGQPVFPATVVSPAIERTAQAMRAPERAVLLAVCKAGARLVAVGEHGVIILSDDQGITWRQARTASGSRRSAAQSPPPITLPARAVATATPCAAKKASR